MTDNTAIVIGGSIAGSFAARVLSDFFDRVIVIDRDEFPAEPVARKGAMQGVHFHALLARGRMVAEQLFPGFGDDLMRRGAAVVDVSESRVYEPYGWGPVRSPGIKMIAASRLLIELALRERAAAIPNVEFWPQTEVIGLMLSADGTAICGVEARIRGRNSVAHPAQLVVDASGRAAIAAAWMPKLGFAEPETTTVNAHWGYASRFYRIPAGLIGPVVGGFPLGRAGSGPPATRGGFLLRQENDTWLITLSGCARDYPPGDEEGFLAFARTLAFPQIGDVIPQAEPISPIRIWRNTVNRRRHFERLAHHPEGLLVLSDAACTFNPIYGQGMSVASIGAIDLKAELEVQRDLAPAGSIVGLGGRFAHRLAASIDYAWNAACRADYRVPGVEGAPPPDGYLDALAYYDRVVALSRDDLDVYEKISHTNQLLRGPEWLDDPELREKVQARWAELGAIMGYERER